VTQKKSVSNKSVEDNKTNSAPLKTVKQPLPKK
jgi:hypothetical protein